MSKKVNSTIQRLAAKTPQQHFLQQLRKGIEAKTARTCSKPRLGGVLDNEKLSDALYLCPRGRWRRASQGQRVIFAVMPF